MSISVFLAFVAKLNAKIACNNKLLFLRFTRSLYYVASSNYKKCIMIHPYKVLFHFVTVEKVQLLLFIITVLVAASFNDIH